MDTIDHIACNNDISLRALPGLPIVSSGDDLARVLIDALERAQWRLQDSDVLVVASKLLSRAEARFVDLSTIAPSLQAEELAHRTRKDARLVELILRESVSVSRAARDVLIMRHRLGFVAANACIDCSNAAPLHAPVGSGPWALLLPENPDASAETLRAVLTERFSAAIGVVVSDSFGRPFRLGTVGVAIGIAGLPPLWDQRGNSDLFGRKLEHTLTALGDQVATAADLVAGQGAEGRGAVLVRGLQFPVEKIGAGALLRHASEDLYA